FDGNATTLGLSPDGRTLAYVSGRHLRFVDVDDHREREVAPLPADASYLSRFARWLPDSSALEIMVGAPRDWHGLRIPRAGGEAARVPPFDNSVYSKDGLEVAGLKAVQKGIEIRRGGEVVTTLPVSGTYAFLRLYDWSSDGRWLLVGTYKDGVTASVWTVGR